METKSFEIAEKLPDCWKKKVNFFLKNRKYNVKECNSNYCYSEKYIYTCLDKYFIVYFPCFWEIFPLLGYFVSSKV